MVDVSNVVHADYNKKQQENKMMLVKIVDSLKWLARQGLAIRGHSSESGNFIQLLKLRGADCPALCEWLSRKSHWLSHDIQNEIIHILGRHVLNNIASEVRTSRWFAVIVDKTSDTSRKEQVNLCLRYVDQSFDVLSRHHDWPCQLLWIVGKSMEQGHYGWEYNVWI